MRLIQVFVPRDDREAVQERLTEMEVEFLFSESDGRRDGSLANVPVPAGAVDVILEGLYDAGLDEDTYTVVTDVDRAKVPNIDEMTDRFVEAPKGERGSSNVEIRERAKDLTPDTATYIAFAIASAVVAVAGLLLNSAIVIVGAMVIAPFAGSTLSMSVGAVISDREMVVDSATSQIVGLVVAYVGAVAMSLFLQQSGFVPATIDVGGIEQVSAFAVTAFGTYQHLVFQQHVNEEIQNVMSDDEYSALELEDIGTEYNDASVFSDEVTVTVTVGRSSDLEYEDLQEAIAEETGRLVIVEVQFVDYQSATALDAANYERAPG